MWETDTERSSGVAYGEKDGPEMFRETTPERVVFKGWKLGGRRTAFVHRLWLTGLAPGRTYSYRLTGLGAPSESFQFRTVPAQTNEVRFIVYADSQIRPEIHRRLVEQMKKHEVDFIVHVGDLVAKGEDYRLWAPQFFELLKGLRERVPIYIARGNHDGPKRIFKKFLAPPGEPYDYGFDYGPLHYFCADNASHWTTSLLLGRIARDAKKSRALWKFVSYHKPSLNVETGLKNWQQRKALPAFAAAGIDFVLAGHSHHYERFHPVQPPGAGSCVTYITTGGGGGALARVESSPGHACAESVYHFCLFHIRGDHLTLDAIDVEGHTIDHLEITKTDGCLDEAYRATTLPMSVMQKAEPNRPR
jgi:predicted phosphodiesterase